MSNAEKVERLRARAAELHAQGQLNQAEQCYRRVLELRRSDIPARYALGVIRLQQGDPAQALVILDPLAAEAPQDGDVLSQRGQARQELGRHQEALADFDRALALKPDNALALFYRGNLMTELEQFAPALENYDRLLQTAPGYDEAWVRRATLLWRMERLEEALAGYGRALQLNPRRFSAAFNAGTILLRLERYDEATTAFETAREIMPDHPYVLGGLASAAQGACDFARWTQIQRQTIQAVEQGAAVLAPLSFLAFCDDGVLRRRCSERFTADRVPAPIAPLWTGERYSHDRIRLAYLSADFRQHATAELIAGLIEKHDRARFEVIAVSFGRDDGSAMRQRLIRAFDHFEDVNRRSDAEAAQWLRQREIDIAVDLKGHTEESRPGILAHRPCPVQVNYLGYPGTIGAPWLDYILADARVLPFARQPVYSEKIVHLPHCYQVNDGARAIGETPNRVQAGLPESGFVFCCFNAAWKIAPAMFQIWMRLLTAVPDSVLWLLDDNQAASRNLAAAAAAHGVDPARLIFAPRVPSAAHLARHRLADLFLDGLPYNAHTTASDALWAGLPLLTCLGAEFDGRVAASLLENIGLPELVTQDLQEYEALALALARDPARLAALKAKLAANRLSCPLYDADGFRRAIEAAYLRMVETARRGAHAESFAVSP
ncbi:MAG TPA: tetratricopeptide repeat protein [Rhizomicrobium sp.]|nr:tetratricopeptide repeat protein [Rhizomicrobium sp.]